MIWYITGASRGLGAEIAGAALSRGHSVSATARDPSTLRPSAFRPSTLDPAAGLPSDRFLATAVDVTDAASLEASVAATVARFGRIDVLVANAGRGLLTAVEEATDEAVRAAFDTNVFGLLATLRAVLPAMRPRRSGRVFTMSSVGGFTTAPGWGLYAGTKFAVEGISEALRMELAPLGIAVTIVEPGGFRTDFLDPSSLRESPRTIDDYAVSAGATRDFVAGANHAQRGDPAKLGQVIVDLAEHPEPPSRIQLGADSVARVEAKLDHVRAELEAWRKVSLSTDL
jgi:NAD(P)-dependent dehydrogenase (short-subunit alcohol dehydrogenase family)